MKEQTELVPKTQTQENKTITDRTDNMQSTKNLRAQLRPDPAQKHTQHPEA